MTRLLSYANTVWCSRCKILRYVAAQKIHPVDKDNKGVGGGEMGGVGGCCWVLSDGRKEKFGDREAPIYLS
jgi:hypothetical protein